MSEHDESHVQDRIEAYLAGGLPPDERVAFEAHAAACLTCGAVLAEARGREQRLNELFEGVRPAAGFEDRVVRNLRLAQAAPRRLIHPMVRRAATGIAAAVLLGGTGWMVSSEMQHRGNPFARVLVADAEYSTAAQSPLASVESNRGIQQKLLGDLGSPPARRWTGLGVDPAPSLAPTGRQGANKAADAASANSYMYYRTGAPQDRFDTTATPQLQDVARAAGASGGAAANPGNANSWAMAGPSFAFKPAELSTPQQVATPDRAKDAKEPELGRQLRDLSEKKESLATFGEAKPEQQAENAPPQGQAAPAKPSAAPSEPGAVPNSGTQQLGDRASQAAVDTGVAPTAGGVSATNSVPTTSPVSSRKVIRNGTMEFEVDRFDDAVMRITKLVDEQGGFVATTDSDKLPNGHMKGTLTLRVPPERLDTLVLTLRGIGDLKSQKISAEDVTKHYTDLDSQLRAARAMEERLLGIIKSGTGQIKDLLAAEKELGVWREKIEAIEGEKRYLDNQVSLSTLVVSLYEKDIRTPASATEAEQVQMSLETEAVDDAYNKALEAIRAAKGRITQSELKQYDAGQFGATIVAAIPPDAAEPVIARLRQLNGRIAHFARDRHQTTKEGVPAPAAAVMQVQREDTIVSLQIYNLANVAPRRTTSLQVAATSVDRAYAQVIEQVRSAGGRIVTSSLTKPDPNTQVADLEVQVPAEKADAVLDLLHGLGDVMRQELSENPDTANVTEAKRGIRLRLVSLAAVPARETQTLQVAASSVPTAFNDILNAAKSADARVFQSDLSEQNPQDVTAAITVEVPRSAEAAVNGAIGKAGQVLTRTINRSADLEKTVDTKVRLTLSLISADRLPPRQTTTEQVQVADVGRATDDLVAAAASVGGRQIGTGGSEQSDANHDTSHVVVEVPMNKLAPVLDELDRAGARRGKQVSFDSSVPDSPLARARIDVTFSNSPASLGGEETTWDALRNGLSVSGRGLRWSLQLLVIGFCFVAPWVLVLWIFWRVIRRSRSRSTPPAPDTT